MKLFLSIACVFLFFSVSQLQLQVLHVLAKSCSRNLSLIFPPTDLDTEKVFVLQFLHSLQESSPPSIPEIFSLSISLSGWYILFVVIVYCVFLSLTYKSSLVHVIISAVYHTKDTSWESIALNVFPPISTIQLQ